jgi:hypothetical protein
LTSDEFLLGIGGDVCPFSINDDDFSVVTDGPVLDEPRAESSGEKLHLLITFPATGTSPQSEAHSRRRGFPLDLLLPPTPEVPDWCVTVLLRVVMRDLSAVLRTM